MLALLFMVCGMNVVVEDTLVEATAGEWAGHYIQNNHATDMKLQEFAIANGAITGETLRLSSPSFANGT